MTLHVHPAATIEYSQAAIWYEEKALGLGEDFLNRIESAFVAIAAHPMRFPEYSLRPKGWIFRRCLLERFPYQLCTASGTTASRSLRWRIQRGRRGIGVVGSNR
jgi:hypothetical protein